MVRERDLEELKERIKGQKIGTIEYMFALYHGDIPTKNIELDMVTAVKTCLDDIKRMTDAHLKKYPD